MEQNLLQNHGSDKQEIVWRRSRFHDVQESSNVVIDLGKHTSADCTDVAVADGGTGASSYFRRKKKMEPRNMGLMCKCLSDTELKAIAGLTSMANKGIGN